MRASPHTRGWTPFSRPSLERSRGFPAHAGMDPARRRRGRRSCRLPRTRGDGPRTASSIASRRSASPHTRGWTAGDQRRAAEIVGFPAHAGMDPARDRPFRGRRRLPRTRGDGPRRGSPSRPPPMASPHTRGWTRLLTTHPRILDGFPAHAGMDLEDAAGTTRGQGLPRTRGDGPSWRRCDDPWGLASPHTRGWTGLEAGNAGGDRGFPAHAGMDPILGMVAAVGIGLPRTRGDGPAADVIWASVVLAFPHTRGWTPGRSDRLGTRPGFPAHAGMDPRGSAGGISGAEASPHTRGWTPRRVRRRGGARGFPAHAGMDRRRRRRAGPARGLPRTRGDGPLRVRGAAAAAAASPHTRGWTRLRRRPQAGRHGFPAHAGMDPAHARGSGSAGGLPRTRGDGPSPQDVLGQVGRASPHTRGWTVRFRRGRGAPDGFPAHAGMDLLPSLT